MPDPAARDAGWTTRATREPHIGVEQSVDIDRLQKACSTCSLRELCLPLGISAGDLEKLDALVQTLGPLHRGAHLFRWGDGFLHLYVVRSGCVKSYVYNEDGEEHVLGFHLPGELVGTDAISRGVHQCSAVALDTGMVCRLPFAELTGMTRRIPGLQQQLFRLMSRDLETSQWLSASHSVDERMAAFLLGFGNRLRTRGFSATSFVLPMKRHEIASYLRLAPETVSRCLARFSSRGLIRIQRKQIEITDYAELARYFREDPRI